MQLFYTPESPYARKARIVAIETGLADGALELVEVTVRDPNSALLRHGPVAKVPALLLADGTLLQDAWIVSDYLDASHDGARLIPQQPAERWPVLAREGLAMALLDGAVVWIREHMRQDTPLSPRVIELEQARTGRCLDALERMAADGRFATSPTIDQVSLACALGIMDLCLPDVDWRLGHSALEHWFTGFSQRPSMVRTHVDDWHRSYDPPPRR